MKKKTLSLKKITVSDLSSGEASKIYGGNTPATETDCNCECSAPTDGATCDASCQGQTCGPVTCAGTCDPVDPACYEQNTQQGFITCEGSCDNSETICDNSCTALYSCPESPGGCR